MRGVVVDVLPNEGTCMGVRGPGDTTYKRLLVARDKVRTHTSHGLPRDTVNGRGPNSPVKIPTRKESRNQQRTSEPKVETPRVLGSNTRKEFETLLRV